MSITANTTRYGYSILAGGWDGKGDSLTDESLGCFGNKLTDDACALTDSMRDALGAKPYDRILLSWDNHPSMIVCYEDRAPESDERVDIWLPWKDDSSIPDMGQVQLCC